MRDYSDVGHLVASGTGRRTELSLALELLFGEMRISLVLRDLLLTPDGPEQ